MLLERLSYYWRIPATGLAFCLMGGGSLLFVLTIFPVVSLTTRDTRRRARRVQQVIHFSFRIYVLLLRLAGVIRLEVEQRDKLLRYRGVMIIANHPTLLDVVLLMSLIPRAQCVVKHQLWRNPFLGGVVRAAGYIRNDQDAETLIAECGAALEAGANLIIFPEGTRSVPGQPLRFQRGFANIALLTKAQIQPLRISCDPITLTKGSPWYDVPRRRACFRVTVEEPIAAEGFLQQDGRALGARRLVSFVEAHYRHQESYGQAGT